MRIAIEDIDINKFNQVLGKSEESLRYFVMEDEYGKYYESCLYLLYDACYSMDKPLEKCEILDLFADCAVFEAQRFFKCYDVKNKLRDVLEKYLDENPDNNDDPIQVITKHVIPLIQLELKQRFKHIADEFDTRTVPRLYSKEYDLYWILMDMLKLRLHQMGLTIV